MAVVRGAVALVPVALAAWMVAEVTVDAATAGVVAMEVAVATAVGSRSM